MSLHKSLVGKGKLVRKRNVLTRWERIVKLSDTEKWSEEQSVFNLPKTQAFLRTKAKKKK